MSLTRDALARLDPTLAEKISALVAAGETAQRYIEHIGANATEAGRPHPQQLLLDQLTAALADLSEFE